MKLINNETIKSYELKKVKIFFSKNMEEPDSDKLISVT